MCLLIKRNYGSDNFFEVFEMSQYAEARQDGAMKAYNHLEQLGMETDYDPSVSFGLGSKELPLKHRLCQLNAFVKAR